MCICSQFLRRMAKQESWLQLLLLLVVACSPDLDLLRRCGFGRNPLNDGSTENQRRDSFYMEISKSFLKYCFRNYLFVSSSKQNGLVLVGQTRCSRLRNLVGLRVVRL